jgi:hypothetical protein
MSQSAAKNSTSSERGKPANFRKQSSLQNWRSVTRFAEIATVSGRIGVACVDLDSVLLHHNPEDGTSRLGRPLSLGRKLTHFLKHKGFRVVVLTSRRGRYKHGMIHQHLASLGFMVDHVTNVKPPADLYADDKAVRVEKNWR